MEAGNYRGVLYTSRTWAQANLLLAEDFPQVGSDFDLSLALQQSEQEGDAPSSAGI